MERIDDTGFSGYKVVQNPEWFCYGVDAVLLADFAKMKKGVKAADLGTGTGIIPLILKHKYDPERIYAVEVQPGVAALAEKTVQINGLEACIRVIAANVKDAAGIIGGGALDAVVTNVYTFEQAAQAFEDFHQNAASMLKVMIEF